METNIERNQDNGRGMFYAIIGVATLVVTIIGATFAYLTANTGSAENAVTAEGAKIDLAYSDIKTGLKKNLIPIDPSLPQFNVGTHTGLNAAGTQQVTYNFVGIEENDCRDVNGNNICSVYQFTITNPAKTTDYAGIAQYVYASLTIKENSFTNLKYAVFKGTDADITERASKTVVADSAVNFNVKTQIKLTDAQKIKADAKVDDTITIGWDVDGSPVTALTTDYLNTSDSNYAYTKTAADATRKHVVANKGDLVISQVDLEKDKKETQQLTPLNQYLDIGESMTYTIVIWVDETGSAQNEDQEKKFAATVKFTTEGNQTGVTGDLDASS